MSRYDDRYNRERERGGRGGRYEREEREDRYDDWRGRDAGGRDRDRGHDRRRSRSRSRDRERRRDYDRRRSRSRSRDGDRDRGRERRRSSRSRSPAHRDSRRRRGDSADAGGSAPPLPEEGAPPLPLGDDMEEGALGEGGGGEAKTIELDAELTPEELMLMQQMGIPFGFDSTAGKHVDDEKANAGAVKVKSTRGARQFMNRRGGFNRPLPTERSGQKVGVEWLKTKVGIHDAQSEIVQKQAPELSAYFGSGAGVAPAAVAPGAVGASGALELVVGRGGSNASESSCGVERPPSPEVLELAHKFESLSLGSRGSSSPEEDSLEPPDSSAGGAPTRSLPDSAASGGPPGSAPPPPPSPAATATATAASASPSFAYMLRLREDSEALDSSRSLGASLSFDSLSSRRLPSYPFYSAGSASGSSRGGSRVLRRNRTAIVLPAHEGGAAGAPPGDGSEDGPLHRQLSDLLRTHHTSLHKLRSQCGDFQEPPGSLLNLMARRMFVHHAHTFARLGSEGKLSDLGAAQDSALPTPSTARPLGSPSCTGSVPARTHSIQTDTGLPVLPRIRTRVPRSRSADWE
eukprot:scaffold1.g5235.t1